MSYENKQDMSRYNWNVKYMLILYVDVTNKKIDEYLSLVQVYSKNRLVKLFPRDYKGVFAQILHGLFNRGYVHITNREIIVDLVLALFLYKPSRADFEKLTIVERGDE